MRLRNIVDKGGDIQAGKQLLMYNLLWPLTQCIEQE